MFLQVILYPLMDLMTLDLILVREILKIILLLCSVQLTDNDATNARKNASASYRKVSEQF